MPDIWHDVDIALSEAPVNLLPLVVAAGTTIDEGVTYDEAGIDLNWNFITTAGVYTQTNVVPTTGGTHDWAHVGNGMYSIEIPASGGTINNDTEGFGWFTGFFTAGLPFRGPVIGFRDSDLNNELIDSAYVATRGLGGTYLDASVAGIPTTAMRGTDSAATSAKQDTMETTLNDVPSTAEFNARTLASADYVVVGDTIARVTLVDTVTTNTDLVTAAAIKTAMEAAGGDLSSLIEGIVNKQKVRHTAGGAGEDIGDVEIYNDAGVKEGDVDKCYDEDAAWSIRGRLFVA